jgi:hypothetical protein
MIAGGKTASYVSYFLGGFGLPVGFSFLHVIMFSPELTCCRQMSSRPIS